MKKKTFYAVSIAAFFLVIALIAFKYNHNKTDGYILLHRKGETTQSPEWISAKRQTDLLINAINTNPEDVKSALMLAALYIREARVTGNYMYYDMAAMKYISHVLKQDPENFNALIYKALIQLNQHHFADGLVTAEKARNINPYNAFVYGILVDGNVEMGNYPAAVENADKMVSIRPDLSSYSRISYLREIHGDLPGAIEAMKMAVAAGAPGDETTEWSRVQLGHLYEQAGKTDYAKMHYTIAADERSGYPYALAGLGRIAMVENNIYLAIAYFEKSDSLINDYSIKEQLASAYEVAGKNDQATKIKTEAIQGMVRDSEKGKNSEDAGHYSDRELAYAYLQVYNFDKSLEHAIAEYNRRPDNIDVNEALAWVHYKRGNAETAMPFLKKALRTHCKNPTLLCHAGLIYAKTGYEEEAKASFEEAFRNNPVIDPGLKSLCLKERLALQTPTK